MTLKKLAAGSGYEYLTRQVAAADSTELGRTRLVDYYEAKGEAPGRWVGSGLVGVDGIEYGDVVTAEQMSHLFGDGCHPVTGTALGRRFGKGSVAGFDLTFSPAKSVSTLWAIAPPEVASRIQQAHDAAVQDALAFLEAHAVFTREGAGGARQVETRGLIAAAFTHRDSRAGDPDLHTHVAVANKVQTRGGEVALDLRHDPARARRRRLGGLQHRPRSPPPRAVSASGSSTSPVRVGSGRCGRSPASTRL